MSFHRVYKFQSILKLCHACFNFLSIMLQNLCFPITVPNRISKIKLDLSLQSLELYDYIQLKSEEHWSVGFVTLSSCESCSVYNPGLQPSFARTNKPVMIWLFSTTALSLKCSISAALVVSLGDLEGVLKVFKYSLEKIYISQTTGIIK